MADENDDKTEPATPRRRQEAREEGQIARSMDLTAAVGLLAALLLLKYLGPGLLGTLFGMTQALGETPGLTPESLWPWGVRVGMATAEALAPLLALLIVVMIVANGAQTGLLLTWKKLSPNADRLNPVSGLKRLFSGDTLTRLAAGIAKMAVVTAVAWFTLKGQIGAVLATGSLAVGGVFKVGADTIWTLALRLGAALLILGLIDYFLQRWRLEKRLRMSKQEIRDEMKKMEGDPHIRQRRRQLQQRLALQRVQREVPRADVVVTNPTHFAVALKYDEASMAAPKVIAKGKDFVAERIRQLAQLHGVPVVQRPPLARALFAGVEVGDEVPPAFYRAVAEILAYVYQLTGKKAG